MLIVVLRTKIYFVYHNKNATEIAVGVKNPTRLYLIHERGAFSRIRLSHLQTQCNMKVVSVFHPLSIVM